MQPSTSKNRAYTRKIQVDKAERDTVQRIIDSTGRPDALFMRRDMAEYSVFWVKIKREERMLIKLSAGSASIQKIKKQK